METIKENIKVKLQELTQKIKEELTEFVGEPFNNKLKDSIKDKATTILQNSEISRFLFNIDTRVILIIDRWTEVSLSSTVENPSHIITFDLTNAWVDLTEVLLERLRCAYNNSLIEVQLQFAKLGSTNTTCNLIAANNYYVKIGENFINISTLNGTKEELSELVKNPILVLANKIKLDWDNFCLDFIKWINNNGYNCTIISERSNYLNLVIKEYD